MAEKVTTNLLVQVANAEDGSLNFTIPCTSPLLLWGVAKTIEKHADMLHMQQTTMVERQKPKLMVPH